MSSINYRGPGQSWLKFISVTQSNCGCREGRLLKCLSSLLSLFCCVSDPQSSRSPEEVLALNAAAIIANIKLQRQLSKKTSSNVRSETDSSASPQGNSGVTTTSCHLYLATKHWSFLRWAESLAGADAVNFHGWCTLSLINSYQIVMHAGRFRMLPNHMYLHVKPIQVWKKQTDCLCLVVVTADGKRLRPHPDQSQPQQQNEPHAAFVPLAPEPESLPESCSLQVSSVQTATEQKVL